MAIAHRVKLGVQAAFGAPDTSGIIPFFKQADCRPVRFEVRRIDHQLIGLPTFRRQLFGAQSRQRKAVPDDEEMPLMIRNHPSSASRARQRKMGLDPRICASDSQSDHT